MRFWLVEASMLETLEMSLQKEEKMPMLWDRGRTSERVTEEDWRVACWLESGILRGRCSACDIDVRASRDTRGAVERSNLYIVWFYVVVA